MVGQFSKPIDKQGIESIHVLVNGFNGAIIRRIGYASGKKCQNSFFEIAIGKSLCRSPVLIPVYVSNILILLNNKYLDKYVF